MQRLRLICLLAWRYTLPTSGDRYPVFVLLVSFAGIALGVAVLIIVASVMNGFGKELRHRILGSIPQVVIYSEGLESARLESLGQVRAVSRFTTADAMLSQGARTALAAVYGVDPETEASVSILPQHLLAGSISALAPGSRQVILGRVLAWQLDVDLHDNLLLVVPVLQGASIQPRSVLVRVAGIFEVGAEVDATIALMNWQDLLAVDARMQAGWRLTLEDSGQAKGLAAQLRKLFPASRVVDWSSRYGDLFTTVQMEKTIMFLLLLLIVAISAFNVVSGLVMLVNEKKGEIAILSTLGLTSRDIMHVFQLRGLLLALPGNFLGVLLGCWGALNVGQLIALIEVLIGGEMLGGSYFTRVPSELRPGDVFAAVALTLVICLLATIFPTRYAARLQPSAVLGHE